MAVGSIAWHAIAAVAVRLERPVQVPRYEDIQSPVVIVIEETRADRPPTASHAGLGRHVRERAISIVVVEDIASVAGDQYVLESVVIIVCNRYTHAVAGLRIARDACLR